MLINELDARIRLDSVRLCTKTSSGTTHTQTDIDGQRKHVMRCRGEVLRQAHRAVVGGRRRPPTASSPASARHPFIRSPSAGWVDPV